MNEKEQMTKKELLKQLLEMMDINNTDIIYDMERWEKIEKFNRYYGGLFYKKMANTPKTYVLSLETPHIEILITDTKKIDIETKKFLVSEKIADFINGYLQQQKTVGTYHIYINNDNRIPRNVGFYKMNKEISTRIKNVCKFYDKCKNRFFEKIRTKEESERDVLIKELKDVSKNVKEALENVLELHLSMLRILELIKEKIPALANKEEKKRLEKTISRIKEEIKN